ncbi:hypothetical protein HPB48_007969 [Haemaphysalis longicornis]|uniref:Peptidase M13 N-terminal domain-containing protein n=1 Tax=Haemaphysalis longicornis TaxID=44386 RepID=A0A9J6GKE9_HAELO|nr:hypothetical protein HPB48_007969 [Haemaphysalis longicornis]
MSPVSSHSPAAPAKAVAASGVKAPARPYGKASPVAKMEVEPTPRMKPPGKKNAKAPLAAATMTEATSGTKARARKDGKAPSSTKTEPTSRTKTSAKERGRTRSQPSHTSQAREPSKTPDKKARKDGNALTAGATNTEPTSGTKKPAKQGGKTRSKPSHTSQAPEPSKAPDERATEVVPPALSGILPVLASDTPEENEKLLWDYSPPPPPKTPQFKAKKTSGTIKTRKLSQDLPSEKPEKLAKQVTKPPGRKPSIGKAAPPKVENIPEDKPVRSKPGVTQPVTALEGLRDKRDQKQPEVAKGSQEPKRKPSQERPKLAAGGKTRSQPSHMSLGPEPSESPDEKETGAVPPASPGIRPINISVTPEENEEMLSDYNPPPPLKTPQLKAKDTSGTAGTRKVNQELPSRKPASQETEKLAKQETKPPGRKPSTKKAALSKAANVPEDKPVRSKPGVTLSTTAPEGLPAKRDQKQPEVAKGFKEPKRKPSQERPKLAAGGKTRSQPSHMSLGPEPSEAPDEKATEVVPPASPGIRPVIVSVTPEENEKMLWDYSPPPPPKTPHLKAKDTSGTAETRKLSRELPSQKSACQEPEKLAKQETKPPRKTPSTKKAAPSKVTNVPEDKPVRSKPGVTEPATAPEGLPEQRDQEQPEVAKGSQELKRKPSQERPKLAAGRKATQKPASRRASLDQTGTDLADQKPPSRRESLAQPGKDLAAQKPPSRRASLAKPGTDMADEKPPSRRASLANLEQIWRRKSHHQGGQAWPTGTDLAAKATSRRASLANRGTDLAAQKPPSRRASLAQPGTDLAAQKPPSRRESLAQRGRAGTASVVPGGVASPELDVDFRPYRASVQPFRGDRLFHVTAARKIDPETGGSIGSSQPPKTKKELKPPKVEVHPETPSSPSPNVAETLSPSSPTVQHEPDKNKEAIHEKCAKHKNETSSQYARRKARVKARAAAKAKARTQAAKKEALKRKHEVKGKKSASKRAKKRQRKERRKPGHRTESHTPFLVPLCLCLLILLIILLLLLYFFWWRQREVTTTTHPGSTTDHIPDQYYCSSDFCNAEAAYLKSLLSNSRAPCDNFYEYVCDVWRKSHPVPGNGAGGVVSTDTILQDKLADELEPILLGMQDADVKVAADLHGACTDRTKLGQDGDKVVEAARKLFSGWAIREWPVLRADAVTTSDAWSFAGELVRDLNVAALVSVSVGVSPENLEVASVELGKPRLVFSCNDASRQAVKELFSGAIEEIMSRFAKPSSSIGSSEVEDVMRVFIRLGSSPALSSSPDTGPLVYYSVRLIELDSGYKNLVERVFGNIITVDGTTAVVLKASDYLRNHLVAAMQELKPHAVANYLGFMALARMAPFFPDKFAAFRQIFAKDVFDRTVPDTSQTKTFCLLAVQLVLPSCVAKAASQLRHLLDTSVPLSEWMSRIENSFRRHHERVAWIDELSALIVRYRLGWNSTASLAHGDYSGQCAPSPHEIPRRSDHPLLFFYQVSVLQEQKRLQAVRKSGPEVRVMRDRQVSDLATVPEYDALRQTVGVPMALFNTSVPSNATMFAFHLSR